MSDISVPRSCMHVQLQHLLHQDMKQTHTLAGTPQGSERRCRYHILIYSLGGMPVLYLHAADASEPHTSSLWAAE